MENKDIDLSKLPQHVIDQTILMMRLVQQNARTRLLNGVPKSTLAEELRGKAFGNLDLDEFLAADTDEKLLALCSRLGGNMLGGDDRKK